MSLDDQRFRARLAALETAHMIHGFVADGHAGPMLQIATSLEEWLMRPAPVDVSKVGDVPGPPRQPCGAYLPPPWFIGTRWLTCTGQHVTAEEAETLAGPHAINWHKGTNSRRFATHHAVEQMGSPRCACGEPWPCAEAGS